MMKKIITIFLLVGMVIVIFLFKSRMSPKMIQPLFDQIEGVVVENQEQKKIFKSQNAGCIVTHTYHNKILTINHTNECQFFLKYLTGTQILLLKRAFHQVNYNEIKEIHLPSLKKLALLDSYKKSLIQEKLENKDDFIKKLKSLNALVIYLAIFKKYKLPHEISSCSSLLLEKTDSNQIIFYDTQQFILK